MSSGAGKRMCPKCKTSDYNNQTFELLINECGHSLCKNCVHNLFSRNTGPCPSCGRLLKKQHFWVQTFDDPNVEKEVHFRKKYKKIYNLLEDDFPTERAFNDYLENFERIIQNLVSDKDADKTKAEIQLFADENADIISRNRTRKSVDERWLQTQLNEHQAMRTRTMQHNHLMTSSEQQVTSGSQVAQTLITQLKDSDVPAELIVDAQRKRHLEATLADKQRAKAQRLQVDNLLAAGGQRQQRRAAEQQQQSQGTNQGQAFVYEAPASVVKDGPEVPSVGDLFSIGYLFHVRQATDAQTAGGFHHWLAAARALGEAYDSLYFRL